MQKERNKVIPEVHLLIIEAEQEIFMLRRFNTGYEDGNYALIAGHVEAGETFKEAIIREAKEEAGIDIRYRDLEIAHIMYRKRGDHERVAAFVVARNWHGLPNNMEPDKCDDAQWFSMGSLPTNVVPYVGLAIENIKNKINYSEYVHDF